MASGAAASVGHGRREEALVVVVLVDRRDKKEGRWKKRRAEWVLEQGRRGRGLLQEERRGETEMR